MQRVGAFSANDRRGHGLRPTTARSLWRRPDARYRQDRHPREHLRKSGPLTSDEWRLMRDPQSARASRPARRRRCATGMAGVDGPVSISAGRVIPRAWSVRRSRCRAHRGPGRFSSTRSIDVVTRRHPDATRSGDDPRAAWSAVRTRGGGCLLSMWTARSWPARPSTPPEEVDDGIRRRLVPRSWIPVGQ